VPAGILLVLALVALLFFTGGDKPDVATAKPAAAPEGGIALTAEAAHAAGITIRDAGRAKIETTITLYGSIKPNAEREQELRARYPGVVRMVSKRPGDAVTAGETLLQVESNESLQTYSIRSPISGRILDRAANMGASVGSDTVLMRVADLKSVWAEFAVFARDLARVQPGLVVHVKGSDNAAVVDTTLTYVAPSGNTESQSVVARAVLDNTNGAWVAGQFASADVVVSAADAKVAVSPSAIQTVNGKETVFVETEGGFVPREVKTGKRSAEAVEILSGIRAGERYAAENSYLIKADFSKGEAEED
jgi:cobalt-zinc-cadmium efflux system membrane fusion protein